ncbi:uncharacterized protein TNIN_316171 [Trichonephila inaurata madagascariensis]|uniref:Uncharacterized protein n=1 Tax=Trichonephila inaurata madagascariensis TaxID=2747483 RepID=A0A8X6XKR1_9ARAC|nr:uncharacterized protein TNIN_316171 [Trichonephila inaurata madagascariensis]
MLHVITQLNAKRFDIYFDQFFPQSIKGYERSLRHESTQLGFKITVPDQVRSSDFDKVLKHIWLKLVNFIILHWSTEEMVPFMNHKNIVNSKKCHSITVINNTVVSDFDENLSGSVIMRKPN